MDTTMKPLKLKTSGILSALAGLALLPFFTERCYGWGAGDGCLKVGDETDMSLLAIAAIAAGLLALIPRMRLPASLVQPFLMLSLIVLGAHDVGSSLNRHDPTPTEGWSLANAHVYTDYRMLALAVFALSLSIAAALIAWRRRHS